MIPYKDSIKKQKESTVLLLLTWDDTREWTYPGKIFEYFGAERPILASALKGGAINILLSNSGCGVVANESEGIKNILEKWILEFRQTGHVSYLFDPDSKIIKFYTRKEQTGRLVEVFERAKELS